MTDATCTSCFHYHDRKVQGGAREREAPYGWCAAKSGYLAADTGRPEGARVVKGDRAEPVIVYPDQIVRGCPLRRDP